MLTPFLLAFVLSYLMNPAVTNLEKRGAPRSLGTLVIYVGFTLFVALFALCLVPRFLTQLEGLAQVLPEYARTIQSHLAAFYLRFSRFNIPEPVKGAIDNGIQRAEDALMGFVERALGQVPGLLQG